MSKMLTRKISKTDVKEMAEKVTDGFIDYPLYKAIFGDADVRDIIYQQIYYSLYTCYDRVFTNEDKTVCVCVMRPGDKSKYEKNNNTHEQDNSSHNKQNLVSIRQWYLFISFKLMKARLCRGIYNPEKDYFIKSLWVDPKLRGREILKAIIDDLSDMIEPGSKAFFETSSEKHVRLYRMLGGKVYATKKWKGITHTLMGIGRNK